MALCILFWTSCNIFLGPSSKSWTCVHFTYVRVTWFCLFKKWCFNTPDDERKKEKGNYTNFLSLFDSNSCLLTLIPETEIYTMNSSPIYLPIFYTSSHFLGPSKSDHVSKVQLIDSFNIYLVHTYRFPPIRCVEITLQKVVKMLTMVYALRSYWDHLCFLLHTPFADYSKCISSSDSHWHLGEY